MSLAPVDRETSTSNAMGSSAELPGFYPITPGGPTDETWWRRFRAGLESGYSLVQLRIKAGGETREQDIIARAAALCEATGCRLILNGSAKWVERYGLAGIHLPSAKLMSYEPANPSRGNLLAASCHSLEELQQAERIGADWACLSPVFRTRSHPDAIPLGLDRFSEWAGQSSIPVYALGGAKPADLDRIRAAGGQGVAGISAFWA